MTDTKPTYAELLRDPRWQRVRLEVMERAGWRCEECGDAGTTLNVHHTYYKRGASPWEYPTDSLRCWCEPCHKQHHDLDTIVREQLGKSSRADLFRVAGYIGGVLEWKRPPDDEPLPAVFLRDGFVDGLADAWGLSVPAVMEAAGGGPLTTNKLMAARRARRR